MARHERGLGRQLSRLEEDLERCELRARYYHDRIAELKAARERLLGREDFEPAEAPGAPAHQGDPPALDGQLGGVLGNLMKSMDADTVRALGEAAKGIDMNAVLGALGGSGGLSQLAGALGGGGGIGQLAAAMGGGGASGGGLAGLLGGLGGSGGGGSVMDGITEVVDFFTKRPAGSSWSVKDLPQALKLLSSPNVRTLVSTASRLNSVWKGVKGLQKAGLPSPAALVPPAAPEPGPVAPALPAPVVRFTQVSGATRVLDPWVGAAAG